MVYRDEIFSLESEHIHNEDGKDPVAEWESINEVSRLNHNKIRTEKII
jgi:hypothetical protein